MSATVPSLADESPGGAPQNRQANVAVAVALVLAIVVIAAFSPGLFGPFLWDDQTLILGNQQVRALSAWRLWFTRDFWDVGSDLVEARARLHYYRPLVTATYALEHHFVGANPFLYHLDNLLAHAATAVLALFTLRRWSGSLAAAALGAAFFALHPTKAESVAWIAGRTDLLCASFVLLAALGAALRLRGRRSGLVLEAVATLLAYLTKEGAVVLPAIVAIEAWVALGRPALDATTIKRLVSAALPQLGLGVAYLAARTRWMPLRPPAGGVPLVDHTLYVFETIGRYLGLTWAPHALSSQHALLRNVDGRPVHELAWVAVGAIGLAASIALAVAARRRLPLLSLGLAAFLGMLLPVSNLVMVGITTLVAERFLYLPLLGAAAAVTGALTLVAHRMGQPKVLGVTVVCGLALTTLTLSRAIDFSDEARFWDHERVLHPESVEAIRFAVRRAKQERRFRAAEALALEGRAVSARLYRDSGMEADFTLLFAEVRAQLTPDLAAPTIVSLDAFYAALLDPRSRQGVLSLPERTLTLSLAGTNGQRVRGLRARLLGARADLASRLGDDQAALASIEQALAACPGCAQPAKLAVMIRARAGDYAGARALVAALAAAEVPALAKALDAAELAHRRAATSTGPEALQLSATELAALEAWGRAYAVLLPARAQLEAAQGAALGFAELAFRAGDAEVARAVLGSHVPNDRIAPMLDEWALKMGWR